MALAAFHASGDSKDGGAQDASGPRPREQDRGRERNLLVPPSPGRRAGARSSSPRPSAALDAPARRESEGNAFGEENASSSWLRHGDKKAKSPRLGQQAEAKKKSARKVPTKFGEKEAPEADARPSTSPRFSRFVPWGRARTEDVPPQQMVQEPDEPKAKRSILRQMAPPDPKKESAEPQPTPGSWHGTGGASSVQRIWQGLGASQSLGAPEEAFPVFGKSASLTPEVTEERKAAYGSVLSASGSAIGSIIGTSSSGVFTDKSNCEVCRKKVGKHNLANRHHCRLCWKNVCSGCSPSYLKIEGYAQLQRVCDPCVRTVTQASVSSAVPAKLAALARDVERLLNGGNEGEDSEPLSAFRQPGQVLRRQGLNASLDEGDDDQEGGDGSADSSLRTLEEAIEPMSLMHQRAVEKVQKLGEKLRAIVVAVNGPGAAAGSTKPYGPTQDQADSAPMVRTRSLLAGTSSDTPRRSSSVGSMRRSASIDRRRKAAENRDTSADSKVSGGRPSGTLRPPDSEGLEAVVNYVSTVVDALEARKRRVDDEASRTRESQATLREDIKKAEATLVAMQTGLPNSSFTGSNSSMTTPLVQRPQDPYEDIPVRRKCPCGCPAPASVTLFGPTINAPLRQ